MRVFFVSCLFSMVFSLPALAANGADIQAQVIDRIVAVIDGEPVTNTEFLRFITLTGKASTSNVSELPKSEQKRLLGDFVQARLIELEAERSNIQVNPEQVANYIQQIKTQNSVDDKGLIGMLNQQGMSLDQYRAQVRFDILQARLLASKVRNKINIVDEDIERYLKQHPELVPEKGHVRLRQFSLLLETPEITEELTAKLGELREGVAKGGEIKSGNGLRVREIGYVDPVNLKKEFADAVDDSEDGILSSVVYDDKAAHFFQIVHRQGEKDSIDAQTRAAIVERLTEKEFRKATEAYFLEKLPERYSVEYKL